MKKLLFILLFLFLIGCAHKTAIQPMCRHTSILCAITFGEKYPVRIVYGEVLSGEHAVAQAYIKDRWQYLKLIDKKVKIADKKPSWIIIYKYVTVEHALKWSTIKFKKLN